MAFVVPDKIRDPLLKWCTEQKSNPDYYKSGMSAKDMLSFAASFSSLEETPERLDTMTTALDDEQPETLLSIRHYLRKFKAADAGVEFTDVLLEEEGKTDEEAAGAGAGAGAGVGAGAPAGHSLGARSRASSFRLNKGPAPKKDDGPKPAETEDQERSRFVRLYNNYMDLDFNKNKVKRTGWTKMPAGYKVLCCGNSKEDLCYILLCFLILYVCVAVFFSLLLEAYLATADNNALLYINVALLALAWITLALVVSAGNRARKREEAAEAAAHAAAAEAEA